MQLRRAMEIVNTQDENNNIFYKDNPPYQVKVQGQADRFLRPRQNVLPVRIPQSFLTPQPYQVKVSTRPWYAPFAFLAVSVQFTVSRKISIRACDFRPCQSL